MHDRGRAEEAGHGRGAGGAGRPVRGRTPRRAAAARGAAQAARVGPVLGHLEARGNPPDHGRDRAASPGEAMRSLRPRGRGTRRLLPLFVILSLPWNRATFPAPPQAFDPAKSDPRAIAIADLVMAALGGQQAWGQTRILYFAFAVERDAKRVAYRTHLWDRWDGRLRYEAAEKDGAPFVTLLDVNTRVGEAYRLPREAPAQGTTARGAAGTVKLEAAAAKPLLDEAYEAWINDTYWLLMPYKMKDPGVRLKYTGEKTIAGADYDLVELTFEDVGLTPRDPYWAHVNRATHIMDRWSYILQDDPPGSEPTVWDWKGWTRRGRILLCPEKVTSRKGATLQILHPILEVYDTLPDAYFTSPGPLPGGMGERPKPAG